MQLEYGIIILFYFSAKSQLREVLEDMQEKSKVKLNYELPDEVVEDYTYEMGRLKFKVNKFRLHLLNPFCLSTKAKILINSNKGRFSNGKTCQSNRSIHTLSGESVSNGRSGFRSVFS